MQIPQSMHEQYIEAKKIIENANDIKVYSHIDCDGICSGAILSTILDRQNKEHDDTMRKTLHLLRPNDVQIFLQHYISRTNQSLLS